MFSIFYRYIFICIRFFRDKKEIIIDAKRRADLTNYNPDEQKIQGHNIVYVH